MNNTVLNEYFTRHEQILHNLITHSDIPARKIKDAIYYSLFPGGKRIRPLLVYLCGQLLAVEVETLDFIAAAIELTHCYSLVHDDLPAMDNDDLRRGKLSCHRAFDEATAILVGDGMQALAIDLLLTHLPKTLSMPQVITVTHTLVKASGPAGMVSGQSLDLSELADPVVNEARLCEIHALKTGKLIFACINMVLAASTAPPEVTDKLRQFAGQLGLVFQMQDDYLDKYNNIILGKGRASDSANQKITFATLYKKQALLDLIMLHYRNVLKTLDFFGHKAENLIELIQYLQNKIKK